MSADNKLLHALYRDMRRIRSLEERVSELFVRSESAGSMLHLSIGEEGIAGIVRAMDTQAPRADDDPRLPAKRILIRMTHH